MKALGDHLDLGEEVAQLRGVEARHDQLALLFPMLTLGGEQAGGAELFDHLDQVLATHELTGAPAQHVFAGIGVGEDDEALGADLEGVATAELAVPVLELQVEALAVELGCDAHDGVAAGSGQGLGTDRRGAGG
jgi:hypothetical protein